MLQDSSSFAQQDMQLRSLREEQVEAQRMLQATDAALKADQHLLDAQEHAQIQILLQNVSQLMTQSDSEKLHQAVQDLVHGTEEFAARRMDQSVRSALSGKKLDDII